MRELWHLVLHMLLMMTFSYDINIRNRVRTVDLEKVSMKSILPVKTT